MTVTYRCKICKARKVEQEGKTVINMKLISEQDKQTIRLFRTRKKIEEIRLFYPT